MKINKIIIILFSLMFLNIYSLVFINDANATSYIFGFESSEGTILGSGVSNSWLTTSFDSGTDSCALVTDLTPCTGTKCMNITSTSLHFVWWNYTYTGYMTKWEGMFYLHSNDPWTAGYLNFYNATGSDLLIQFWYSPNSLANYYLYYHSATMGDVTFGLIPDDIYIYLSWQYNFTDEVLYKVQNQQKTGAPYTISTNPQIKHLKFNTVLSHLSCRIDNTNITISSTLLGNEISQENVIFCTSNGYITAQTELDNKRFLETQYIPITGLGLNGNITDLTFPISTSQYNQHGNTSYYDLTINGVNKGHPTNIINYSNANCPYALYWNNVNIALIDNHPIFSFGCYKIYASKYWTGFAVDTSTTNLHYKIGNIDAEHNNSIYDGSDTINYNMFFCFTLENYEIGEIPENTSGTNNTIGDFYFYFYDITTGNPLYFKGKNIAPLAMGALDYIDGLIYSSITTNGLSNSYFTTQKVTITANFTDGDYITFYIMDTGFIDFQCRISFVFSYFKVKQIQLQLYHGQFYTIYLEPTSYIDGVNYNYCGGNGVHGLLTTDPPLSVCLTKSTYDYGETARIQYTLPSGQWLNENGWLTIGWRFAFYNRNDYFFGLRLNNWDYIHTYSLSPSDFDANRHTYEFEITNYNNHGYNQYYNDYEICIINFEAGLFDLRTLMFENLIFYVTGSTFVPNGTIQTIAPNPAYFGQPVTFAWISNGVGRIEINYPSGDKYFSVEYLYSDGVHTLTRSMTGIGIFSIELYTYGTSPSNTSLPVDTDTLVVNPLGGNGTFGSYGFGVPYLYIPNYRMIAGYDTLQIYYRTYLNNSRLNITSPRGEMTYFSTTVSNQSDNVLNIEIPNYMQIGTWNVTLDGGDIYGNKEILLTTFNVVNEENNWIEFSKHTFYDDEAFSVYIKHSYRVALTFYKEGIAEGETIILNVGEQDNTLYVISTQSVQPSLGNWNVEMWRINDRNQIYELAEWNCRVIATPLTLTTGVTIFNFDLLGYIESLPLVVRYTIGIVITILITILPFIIMLYASRHSNLSNITLPSVVYLGLFVFGETISTLLRFFDWAVVALTLIAIILGFMIYWLRQNKSESGGD